MKEPNTQLPKGNDKSPKITIITVVFNNENNVGHAIESVLNQTYDNIEYIVIDGKSTDRTWERIQSYQGSCKYRHNISQAISEKDEGLYDALNKGIAIATGDYIGFVHADDSLYDENVLADVAQRVAETDCDMLYGDGVYVDINHQNKVVRNWQGGTYSKGAVRRGWLPLHPTVFIKKSIYEKYGVYDKSFRIAGDTDLLIRMLYKHDLSVAYIHRFIIRMAMGGMSTSPHSSMKKWKEDIAVLHRYGMPSWVLACKVMRKMPQYLLQLGFYEYMLKKTIKKIVNK